MRTTFCTKTKIDTRKIEFNAQTFAGLKRGRLRKEKEPSRLTSLERKLLFLSSEAIQVLLSLHAAVAKKKERKDEGKEGRTRNKQGEHADLFANSLGGSRKTTEILLPFFSLRQRYDMQIESHP